MTYVNFESVYMQSNLKTLPSCPDVLELLKANPLFKGFDEELLKKSCAHFKIAQIDEGETIFNRGDTVHHFYFVVSGLVKLYRQSPNGQEKIIELEKAGQTFAEALMFFDQAVYPVSAIAMESSIILTIQSRFFMELLESSTAICINVMGELSHRLHELINDVEQLSLMTGRNRVAMYFLDQSQEKGLEFKLDIPKNAIASLLSLQPETFSRLLKELTTKAAIIVKENQITVLDQNLLRKFAGIG